MVGSDWFASAQLLVNALRAHLAEFGVIAPQGLRNVGQLIAIVRNEKDARLPDLAHQVLQVLAATDRAARGGGYGRSRQQLMAWHKSNPVSQRLATIPASGQSSPPQSPRRWRNRAVSAAAASLQRGWVSCHGRTPPAAKSAWAAYHKRGNQYLRRLLINGASANLLRSKATNADPWVIGLRATTAEHGRGGGTGEQDGAHRLGGDAPAGELPAHGCSGLGRRNAHWSLRESNDA